MGAGGEQDKVEAAGAAATTPARRRWRWKRLLWLPVLFVGFSCLQVLVLRLISSPFTPVVLWRYGVATGEGVWSYPLPFL